nr:MAG TPA: Putative Vgr protein-stranded beta-helix, All beta proteins.95A [Caudoviricetes sp.]
MWLSEIKRKSEPDGALSEVSVNADGDINLETANARICIKNNGDIIIEGSVTVNGSSV